MFEARISRIYPGANIYGSKATLVVQLNSLQSDDTDQHHEKDFYNDLIRNINQLQPPHTKAWDGDLPGLICPVAKIDLAECIAYLAVLFQRWIGYPVSEYSCQPAEAGLDHNASLIFIEYSQLNPAVAALTATVNLLSILEQHPDRVQHLSEMRVFRQFVAQYVGKPAAQVKFIREAQRRNIPWRNLGETDEYLELGHGRKRQRVFRQFSMKTSFIATRTSTNKSVTNHLLRSRGLPVPPQFVLANEQQAVAAFHKLRAPVVVKPLATDYGTAVHPGLMNVNEVVEAFHVARRYGNVVMESHIAGDHHRIMIINGKFTSARRQLPAHVIGNGSENIRQLVDEANQRRLENGWALIPTDEESQALLKRQQLFWESVPVQHQRVNLRLQGNLSTGGTMEIVTDVIHRDNIVMAKRAAAIMDIDIAGIDFITTDISKSYHESGGQICEINVTPGFIFNEEKLVFDNWFPNKDNGRIPVLVFLDIHRNSHLSNCLTDVLRSNCWSDLCIVNEQGAFLNGNRLCDKSFSVNQRIELALSEPEAAAAAIFLDSKDVIAQGVCLSHIDFLYIADIEGSIQEKEFAEKLRAVSVLSPLSQPLSQFALSTVADAARDKGLRLQSLEDAIDGDAKCIACQQGITSKDGNLLRRVSAFVASIQG